MDDSNVRAVVEKHAERAARGMSKYGVTTDRADLSLVQWLQHLQEELMDAAVYVERVMKDLAGSQDRKQTEESQ